jgi:hypothetical protein
VACPDSAQSIVGTGPFHPGAVTEATVLGDAGVAMAATSGTTMTTGTAVIVSRRANEWRPLKAFMRVSVRSRPGGEEATCERSHPA